MKTEMSQSGQSPTEAEIGMMALLAPMHFSVAGANGRVTLSYLSPVNGSPLKEYTFTGDRPNDFPCQQFRRFLEEFGWRVESYFAALCAEGDADSLQVDVKISNLMQEVLRVVADANAPWMSKHEKVIEDDPDLWVPPMDRFFA